MAELHPCAEKLQRHMTTAGTNGDLGEFCYNRSVDFCYNRRRRAATGDGYVTGKAVSGAGEAANESTSSCK